MPYRRLIPRQFPPGSFDRPSPPGSKYVHFVNTLNPERLTSKDYLGLSGRKSTDVWLTTLNLKQAARRPRGLTHPTLLEVAGSPVMDYPPNMGGFLYLHPAPPGAPQTAAEIRFRITNNPNPGSFLQGTDRMQNGLPWSRQLLWCYIPLVSSLLSKDRLMAGPMRTRVENLQAVSNQFPEETHNSKHLLYARNQPFCVYLTAPRICLWLLQEVDGRDKLTPLFYRLPSIIRNTNSHEPTTLAAGRKMSAFRGLYCGESRFL